MQNDPKNYSGSATLTDGTRVPLSSDQAEDLWKMADDAKTARAEAMPTAQDALRTLLQAEDRLRELGWWRGGGLKVRRGDECAVAEQGSTGIWKGRLDAEGKFVHYGDSVSSPQKTFLKPLADLTEDERQHMNACDRDAAEAYAAMIDRFREQHHAE